MPAITRRRGSAATFGLGLAGGLAFCSGGNFSTGSAIALLLPWRLRGRILDGVADVFLDGLQLREQPVGVGRIDALECRGGQFRSKPAKFPQQRPRGPAQIQPIDAAVGLVVAPFDPAIVAETI